MRERITTGHFLNNLVPKQFLFPLQDDLHLGRREVEALRNRAVTNRILLINYDFPPGLSGVRRIVKFAKFLPEFGYAPLVLCARPDERMPLDFDTLAETEAGGYPVFRTPSMDPYHLWNGLSRIPQLARRGLAKLDTQVAPAASNSGVQSTAARSLLKPIAPLSRFASRALALPDDRVGWLPFAIPAADHILRSQAVRYVLTSSFPHSTHLIGAWLKKEYRIRWVADFRDGWTQNPYFSHHATPLHRKLSARWEARVAREADALLTVSEPIARHLRTLTDPAKVHVIPNGYDPEDFDGVEPIEFDRFTLAYTGTLFMQRSPDNLLAALRGLLDSHPGLADNLQVIFRTKFKPEHIASIHQLGLQDVVHNWGLGSYREALQLQKSADALLVLEGEAPNSEIMLTQKIFEYLATGKPVVAVCPPGALADLVRRTSAGVVISPHNIFRLKEVLHELFLGRLNFNRDEQLIATFHRREQTRQLAQVLRNL